MRGGKAAAVPGMLETIFSLGIGKTSEPRHFLNGWWIIRCLDHSPTQTRRFEDVREACRIGAMLAKTSDTANKQEDAKFAAWQKKASIQAFWQQYAKLVPSS